MSNQLSLSIVIPAKNEAKGLELVLPQIKALYPDAEVIVVDDGSTDNTVQVVKDHGATAFSHPYSKGNGAAIKSGARLASGDTIVFMDADGQHRPEDISRLLEKIEGGFDMVVGARSSASQADVGRGLANALYNWLSSRMVGHEVQDLTSGFRAVNREKFLSFLYLLPNGFSYPTTITMAFFRVGWSLVYIPIVADKREGKSHISPLKDGVRFLLIIFKIATLYSPLKLFFPVSILFFVTGCCYYAYTYIEMGRFTNMSALLFISAMLVFLMGLVSEQVTTLLYKDSD